MRYVCLGYLDPKKWEAMSESEPLQTAATLRFQNGPVMITEGPYTETKEQLGGS